MIEKILFDLKNKIKNMTDKKNSEWNPAITPWQIREQDMPGDGNFADQLKFLLRYAILAPSGHNSQPWKFSIDENEIKIFSDKTRWLKVGDPDKVNLYIGIGCAIENLLIAAEHFGFGYQISYLPKPDQEELAAIVKFTRKGKPSSFRDPALFHAIPNRHTNRKVYKKRPIPKKDIKRLQNCCVEENIKLHIINDIKTKEGMNKLLVHGHTMMVANPAFRKENAYWIGHGLFNMPQIITKLAQLIVPHLKINKSIFVMMDTRLVMSAPALIVLSANVNNRVSQIKTGQVFERVCLTATMLGLCAHPLSGMVDVPELKSQVSKLLPNPGMISQHVFRIGYAEPVKSFAQRRPLDEVLIANDI